MIWMLTGCLGGKFSGVYTVDRESSAGGVQVTEVGSDTMGLVELIVPMRVEDSSILLTVQSEAYLALEEVYDANSDLILSTEDWYFSNTALTDAFFPDATDMVFNWPVRDGDPELTEGNWTFVFSTLNSLGVYTSGQVATAYTQIKEDTDLSQGTLAITVGITPLAEADAEVDLAVDAALDCWQDLWLGIGIDVQFSRRSVALSENIPFPESSPEIQQIAEEGSDEDILMIIGESISGLSDTYGIAGSIPGTLLATERSAVSISWLEHAGLDASFSASEIQVMCETMAHETGHYIGLYHPVESDYLAWDALEDTVECFDSWDCEAALSTNLMYPYPICSGNSCVQQTELSQNQQAVVHRYTGTR